MPVLTLFTDASYCPSTGAGGWGAWMRFGPDARHIRRHSGQLKSDAQNSTGAELAAVVNGLVLVRYVLRVEAEEIAAADARRPSPRFGGSTIVALRTDSQEAVRILRGRGSCHHSYAAECAAAALEIVSEGKWDFRPEWVKGRRGTQDPRAAVNTWCDKAAGEHMRVLREQLNPRGSGSVKGPRNWAEEEGEDRPKIAAGTP